MVVWLAEKVERNQPYYFHWKYRREGIEMECSKSDWKLLRSKIAE